MADEVVIKKSTLKLIGAFVAGLLIGGLVGGNMTGGSGSQQLQPQQPSDGSDQPQRVDVSLDDDPSLGSEDAPVKIVEFSDYQCPFCQRFYQNTLPRLKSEYIDNGDVQFVYRDFPLEQLGHVSAEEAAQAAHCAGDQGKYWEMHDKIFERKDSDWGPVAEGEARQFFVGYAEELNLNTDQFKSCLDSGKYKDEVQKDLDDGTAAGVQGTPTFFIGNEDDGFVKLVGAQPFSAFQQVIDQELEG